MKCPECQADANKVIYMGAPMKTCDDCHLLWGFWSFIPFWFGYNGVMMQYDGSYLKALWYWLTTEDLP